MTKIYLLLKFAELIRNKTQKVCGRVSLMERAYFARVSLDWYSRYFRYL